LRPTTPACYFTSAARYAQETDKDDTLGIGQIEKLALSMLNNWPYSIPHSNSIDGTTRAKYALNSPRQTALRKV
jgi:hypothetical protein